MISTRFNATEWLTSNMHRAYPLHESTAGICPIPTALLADMFILVVGAEDSACSFYVSEIRTTDTSVIISMAGMIGNSDFPSTPIATFPLNSKIGDVASGSFPLGEYVIHTKLIVGDASAATSMPVQTTLDESEGLLFTGCVRGVTDVNSGVFVVNGTKMSDPLFITAGEGIKLDVKNFSARVSMEIKVKPEWDDSLETITKRLERAVLEGSLADFSETSGGLKPGEDINISSIDIGPDGTVSASVVNENGETSELLGTIKDPDTGETVAPEPGTTFEVDPRSLRISNVDPTNTLKIGVDDYGPTQANMIIMDDLQLLREAIAEYGTPIRSINGVYPDENGDLTILPDDKTTSSTISVEDGELQLENFYAAIAGVNNTAGALRITLSRPIKCDTTEVVERLMTNIAELNKRATILANTITQLDAANSNLASKISEMTQ